MSRVITIVLVVALSMSAGCGRIIGDRDSASDPEGQRAGDEAFSRGRSDNVDLDIQDFDYDEFDHGLDEAPTQDPGDSDVDEPEPVQDDSQNDAAEPQPTPPPVVDGFVTEVFRPIPAETGTVVLDAEPIDNRTMAGDDAENQAFRAFWSFDVSKVRSSDVQQATLQFSHKETVGDPFRLDNQNLGLRGVRVWIIRTEAGELPPYAPEDREVFTELTANPIFESPTEYDLTTYVKNIGDNMSRVNRVQIMVGFQRGTNNNNLADYMEWESATLTVTYAPHS